MHSTIILRETSYFWSTYLIIYPQSFKLILPILRKICKKKRYACKPKTLKTVLIYLYLTISFIFCTQFQELYWVDRELWWLVLRKSNSFLSDTIIFFNTFIHIFSWQTKIQPLFFQNRSNLEQNFIILKWAMINLDRVPKN